MTYKHLFFDDYSEGAHPRILEALTQTNFTQERGYGQDNFSLEAISRIKDVLKDVDIDVHFVSGGTQANLIVLASMLKPYESVIAATTGHINIHEAGAIEATGHKIHGLQGADGKLSSDGIREVVIQHTDEHMVKPRVVFISQATEVGTIYRKKELEDISETCKELDLYLYLDGARLGSALASSESDLQLSDIARLVDVFYMGGTKNGALMGEAIVIPSPQLKKNFRYHIKQRGGLLAKGRIMGVQFAELFKDGLFLETGKHANTLAEKMATGIRECGYEFLTRSSTNQIFPIFPNKVIEELQENYGFYIWSKIDTDRSVIRLVTSWATTEDAVMEFLTDLKAVS
jgi:threonine aldolase